MSPKERERFRRLLRLSVWDIFGIRCLHCNRPLNTLAQRLWHRLVCWKDPHPKQATRRSRIEED